MAARVTPEDVAVILDLEADVFLYPFIQTATALVTGWLATSDLSATELFEIERWVSAHLVALRHPSHTQVGSGVYTVKLETPKVEMGLAGTRYGQVAMTLDRTGTLARAGRGIVSTVFEAL